MQRIFLFGLLCLLTCNTLFAQFFRFGVPNLQAYDKERFHYGFSLGIDIVDINIKTRTNYVFPDNIMGGGNTLQQITSSVTPAFHVGILGNMRLGEYFDLRFIPAFSIAHEINLYYRFTNEVQDPNPRKDKPTYEILRQIDCQYINLPLFIKFKSSRMHNVRLYALGGGQFSINMMSAKNNSINTMDPMGIDIIPIIKPYDVQVRSGFGFDFYTTYFKLSTEFSVSFGVINMLEDEKRIKDKDHLPIYRSSPIIQGITDMKSKTFTISLVIE
ncbi:MAG: PorT family protein [Bacteroidales bacterium]|jgi:hypothetical protein|nr:PorT family protein [Bacteroidales bacterium]